MNVARRAILVILLFFGSISMAMAGNNTTLLGIGTLKTPGDLTRFQVDDSHILEFLDLTSTAGWTVEQAVSTFAADGFHWANGSEMTDMLRAFGMTYSIVPGGISEQLGGTDAQRASYISYFGTPGIAGNTSNSGWVDDHTTDTFHSYLCVGVVGCGTAAGAGGAFVNSTDNATIWPSFFFYGTYLVRSTSISPVPETPTPILMIVGFVLLGCALLRQRRFEARL